MASIFAITFQINVINRLGDLLKNPKLGRHEEKIISDYNIAIQSVAEENLLPKVIDDLSEPLGYGPLKDSKILRDGLLQESCKQLKLNYIKLKQHVTDYVDDIRMSTPNVRPGTLDNHEASEIGRILKTASRPKPAQRSMIL